MGRPTGRAPPPHRAPRSSRIAAAAGSAGRTRERAGAAAEAPAPTRHVGGVRGPEAAGQGRDHAGRHPEGEDGAKRRARPGPGGPGGCSCRFLPRGERGRRRLRPAAPRPRRGREAAGPHSLCPGLGPCPCTWTLVGGSRGRREEAGGVLGVCSPRFSSFAWAAPIAPAGLSLPERTRPESGESSKSFLREGSDSRTAAGLFQTLCPTLGAAE